MCFYSKIFAQSDMVSRLIWQDLPGSTWERSGWAEQIKKDISAKKEPAPTWKPPEETPEEIKKPIDPGSFAPNSVSDVNDPQYLEKQFPDIAQTLLRDLNKIEAANTPASKGRLFEQLTGTGMLRDMKRAFFYKAVVENWTEKTLYEEFEQHMNDWKTRCQKEPLTDLSWLGVRIAWEKFWGASALGIAPDDNPNLKNRIIQLSSHKALLLNRFGAIKSTVKSNALRGREKIEDGKVVPGEYDEPKIDMDQLEFVDEVAVPFYMNYYINRGIMENANVQELVADYEDRIVSLYNSALK